MYTIFACVKDTGSSSKCHAKTWSKQDAFSNSAQISNFYKYPSRTSCEASHNILLI